jgi:Fe-S-cluster containining protein
VADSTDDAPLTAGRFGPWLDQMLLALRGEAESDVPCGECVACCASRQFVHVEPDETDALAHIPDDVQFPAPGLPAGHVVLGHDIEGRCPMLGERGCTIYEHRPRACRVYDCRVFVASGIEPDDDQPAIVRRVRRWRFEPLTDDDAEAQRAVRAVAVVLDDPASFPGGRLPPRSSQRAVIAVGLHELGRNGHRPTPDEVCSELIRRSS